jgi:hypothetical protein
MDNSVYDRDRDEHLIVGPAEFVKLEFQNAAQRLFHPGPLNDSFLQFLMQKPNNVGGYRDGSSEQIRLLLDDKLKALPEAERIRLANAGMADLGSYDDTTAKRTPGLDRDRFKVLVANGGDVNIGMKSILSQYEKDHNLENFASTTRYITELASQSGQQMDHGLATKALNFYRDATNNLTDFSKVSVDRSSFVGAKDSGTAASLIAMGATCSVLDKQRAYNNPEGIPQIPWGGYWYPPSKP